MAYQLVDLTPQQEQKWAETRVALLWHCPAFSHIFYTMLNNHGSKHVAIFTADIPIAATDGRALILNPETYFALDLNRRIFVAAHEIMHCVWNHPIAGHGYARRGSIAYLDGTELPYFHQIANVAMDLVINDLLINSKIGTMVEGGCHDTNLGTGNDAWTDVYRKIFEQMEKQQGGGKGQGSGKGSGGSGSGIDPDGKGNPGGNFDTHLQPGTSEDQNPDEAAQARDNAQWSREVAAGAASAKLQGKLPAGLERAFSELLEPTIDWKEQIKALFARKVGSGSYNWRMPDRRLISRDIYSPARSGNGCGDIVVAIDTSGSIGQKELDMFFAEMGGILSDCVPARLFVVWCDAKVHRVDVIDAPEDLYGLKKKGAPGGGGTAFEPVFEWANNEGLMLDALVYLTDGYGSFPQDRPSYPVIWGDIANHENYPFGDVVHIPR